MAHAKPWVLHHQKNTGIDTETLTGAAKYDGDYFAIIDGDGEVVCDNADYYAQSVDPENMGPIVKCVNSHDALVAALQDVAQTLDWMQNGKCRGFSDGLLSTNDALEKARAALKLAKD